MTRRLLTKMLATVGLVSSSGAGCAYDPGGSNVRSELNSAWLIDRQRLLFVLTGTDSDPARPAIWDTRHNTGTQYISPDKDKWQDVSASQDGAWLIGTVHEYDETHRAWPLVRNRIAMCRLDGSGYRKFGTAYGLRLNPVLSPDGRTIWYTKATTYNEDMSKADDFELFSFDISSETEIQHSRIKAHRLYVRGFDEGGVWTEYATTPREDLTAFDMNEEELAEKFNRHEGMIRFDVSNKKKPLKIRQIGDSFLVSDLVFMLGAKLTLVLNTFHAQYSRSELYTFEIFYGKLNDLRQITRYNGRIERATSGYGSSFVFIEYRLLNSTGTPMQAIINMNTGESALVRVPDRVEFYKNNAMIDSGVMR